MGYTAAAEAHRDLEARLAAVFRRIEDIEPVSIAGLAVQARAALDHKEPGLLQELLADRLSELAASSVPPVLTEMRPTGHFAAMYQEANRLRDVVNSSEIATVDCADPAFHTLVALEGRAKEMPVVSADDAAAALEWVLAECQAAAEGYDRTDGFIEGIVGNVIAYLKRPSIAWPAAAEATQAARAA